MGKRSNHKNKTARQTKQASSRSPLYNVTVLMASEDRLNRLRMATDHLRNKRPLDDPHLIAHFMGITVNEVLRHVGVEDKDDYTTNEVRTWVQSLCTLKYHWSEFGSLEEVAKLFNFLQMGLDKVMLAYKLNGPYSWHVTYWIDEIVPDLFVDGLDTDFDFEDLKIKEPTA